METTACPELHVVSRPPGDLLACEGPDLPTLQIPGSSSQTQACRGLPGASMPRCFQVIWGLPPPGFSQMQNRWDAETREGRICWALNWAAGQAAPLRKRWGERPRKRRWGHPSGSFRDFSMTWKLSRGQGLPTGHGDPRLGIPHTLPTPCILSLKEGCHLSSLSGEVSVFLWELVPPPLFDS